MKKKLMPLAAALALFSMTQTANAMYYCWRGGTELNPTESENVQDGMHEVYQNAGWNCSRTYVTMPASGTIVDAGKTRAPRVLNTDTGAAYLNNMN